MKLVFSWKATTLINLVLGAFLWFLFSTDYSLTGNIPDILHPPIVGIIALISLFLIKTGNRWQRLLMLFAHLPSIIGGGLYVIIAVVMLIPPFTLGTAFTASEIASETHIQQADSPDGTRTAHVYFRGVGAYSGGNGRIFVRVTHQMLPFLERDIFYLRRSDASESSEDYLEWRSNNIIYISEVEQEISVGIIKPEIPQVIVLFYSIFQFFSAIAEQAIVNQQQTVPVRDVPIYPGSIFSDQSQYSEGDQTVFRSFNIEQGDIEKVKAWYEEALAKSPWKFVRIDRYTITESDAIHVRYCLQATRDIGGEQRLYYWELMGSNDLSRSVHINIGTPNPITGTCERYTENP